MSKSQIEITTITANSGLFSSGINIANQTSNTIASFDAGKNMISLSTGTYPSLTELSYVKGVTSAIQTQINTKQNTLTNPVTGVGVSGYVGRWISSSGVGSGILYDNGVRVGIGTITPTGNLHVTGTGIFNSRLGVNTNSPITAGHIYGTLTVDGAGQSANLYSEGIRIGAASNGFAIVTFGVNAANPSGTQANQWWVGKDGRDNGFNIFVSGAGSDSFHITTSGNIGIGTMAPVSRLQVSGLITANSGNFTNSLQLNGTGVSISGHTHTASQVGAISGVGASGYLARWTANSGINSGILYDTLTAIGIRTISPAAELHVNGSGYFASGLTVTGILVPQSAMKTPINSTTTTGVQTVTLNLNDSNLYTITMSGNTTLALNNPTAGQRFTIRLRQDSVGSRLVTWFSGVSWPSAINPTLTTTANKTDVFGFICTASGAYDGFILGYNI